MLKNKEKAIKKSKNIITKHYGENMFSFPAKQLVNYYIITGFN